MVFYYLLITVLYIYCRICVLNDIIKYKMKVHKFPHQRKIPLRESSDVINPPSIIEIVIPGDLVLLEQNQQLISGSKLRKMGVTCCDINGEMSTIRDELEYIMLDNESLPNNSKDSYTLAKHSKLDGDVAVHKLHTGYSYI